MSVTSLSDPSRRSRGTVQQRLAALPLLYKVLIANSLIVLAGAVFGTYATVRFVHEDVVPTREWLALIFGAVGLVLSLAVNYWVLRAAFEPLDTLERVATAVRNGDFSARSGPFRFSDPQLARLAETFDQTLDELERDREELRHLAVQVIGAQEEERKRIARELHDDTAQVLFAQLLRVTALKASPNEDLRAAAEAIEDSTVEAIEGVRRLALELRPPALDDLGLREALGDLAQRFSEQLGIQVHYNVTGLRDRLRPEVELMLYRVAQEAMTNVAKHAAATEAWITLVRSGASVTMAIDDNGTGFDPTVPGSRDGRGLGLGLFGMEERVSLVGGTLSITRLEPTGMRILAHVPLDGVITPTSAARRKTIVTS
jgi:two-component system sensor histidine kinase UhpB